MTTKNDDPVIEKIKNRPFEDWLHPSPFGFQMPENALIGLYQETGVDVSEMRYKIYADGAGGKEFILSMPNRKNIAFIVLNSWLEDLGFDIWGALLPQIVEELKK
jgi:hypothetical protein